jgi:hypothetical protein
MDFVLGLDEAQVAFDELMNEELWSVPNGNPKRRPIDRLCDSLADRGLLTNEPKRFDFEFPVWNIKQKKHQIDSRGVRDGLNIFIYDKHGAALGAFELLLVVAGEVHPLPNGTHRVIIEKKGVFMEDQYDLEGGQYFGYWNIQNHTASLLPSGFGGCLSYVDNSSFRAWRQVNSRGGDYFIYSDLRAVTLENPYIFYCPTGFSPG